MPNKTKRDLVQEIASDHALNPHQVHNVVQSFLEKVIETLSSGQRLEFRHFGVFEVVSRKAKIGRNPKRADVAIAIPQRSAVKFTPSKKMKKMVSHAPVGQSLSLEGLNQDSPTSP